VKIFRNASKLQAEKFFATAAGKNFLENFFDKQEHKKPWRISVFKELPARVTTVKNLEPKIGEGH